MTGSESVDDVFILSASVIFFPGQGIWFDFFELVNLINPLSVLFIMHGIINIWK